MVDQTKETDFEGFYHEVKMCTGKIAFDSLHRFKLDISFQVKAIEKRDAVLTSEQQITRLLRPGSSYFNLNPYEVLQVDPADGVDAAKTKYKRVN